MLLWLLPGLLLMPLGLLWLWDHQAVRWWVLAVMCLGLGAFALRRALARSAERETASFIAANAPPSPEWSPREREAWCLVEDIAAKTEPFQSTDLAPILAALERVASAVAQHFKGDAPEHRWDVTLPELLLLIEHAAHDTRRAILRLPGIRHITISDARWIQRQTETHGPAISRTYEYAQKALRLARMVRDPMSGILGEIGGGLFGSLSDVVSLRIRAAVTGLLIRECGRAAINLYAGRLRLSEEEIATADTADKTPLDTVGPIKLLLVGQANAGKSTIFNALAGRVQQPVGGAANRRPSEAIRLQREGYPEVILREMSGLPETGTKADSLLKEVWGADLILWVASAVQPARKPDVDALYLVREALAKTPSRVPPPMLLVLSHIDQLSPKAEWEPPYDLADEARPKARQIREAKAHVSQELGFAAKDCVPIASRNPTDPGNTYGVEALWALIDTALQPARAAKLSRHAQTRTWADRLKGRRAY